MTSYTTATGYYVLVDSSGTVIAKSNVPAGEHPVTDDADPSQSFDVESEAELKNYSVGDTV